MLPLLWSVASIALLFFVVWFFMPAARATDVHYVSMVPETKLDVRRLKSALKAVENTRWDFVHPYSGARSVYQFKEATWRQWSGKPFQTASLDTHEASIEIERVATKHINWLVSEIGKRRYTVSPDMVGQAWKAGLTAWMEHRQTFEDTQFGIRVSNCYADSK